jgi:hypothetical protein
LVALEPQLDEELRGLIAEDAAGSAGDAPARDELPQPADGAALPVARPLWWGRNGRYVVAVLAVVFGLGLAGGFASGLLAGLLL